jgi:hypothetical protein
MFEKNKLLLSLREPPSAINPSTIITMRNGKYSTSSAISFGASYEHSPEID